MLERNLGTTGPNGGVTVWSNFWVSLYDGQTRQEWGNANEGSASNFGWIIGDEKTGYGHAAFERALAWMTERMAER